MQGKPSKKKRTQTRLTHRPRSGPELFGAEPVSGAARGDRPCASQAQLVLRGRHLGEGHRGLASMVNVRVTAGLNELLSLVTFFAAVYGPETWVTPVPGHG
ncbi:protein of unknown function [Caballeronia sp. S22]